MIEPYFSRSGSLITPAEGFLKERNARALVREEEYRQCAWKFESYNTTRKFTGTLLLKTHTPQIASQILTEKIKSHVLNRNPIPPSNVVDGCVQRRWDRESKEGFAKWVPQTETVGYRAKRKSWIYEIPRGCQQYEINKPLHWLWLGSAQGVLFDDAGILQKDIQGESFDDGVISGSESHEGWSHTGVVRRRCACKDWDQGHHGERAYQADPAKGFTILLRKSRRIWTMLWRTSGQDTTILL